MPLLKFPGNERPAKRALYDNLEGNEDLALKLDEVIKLKKKDSWRGNKFKEKEVFFAIKGVITDKLLAREIFEVVKNQNEY